jgi:CubicO group peptidase (beta-lactamase class C family)
MSALHDRVRAYLENETALPGDAAVAVAAVRDGETLLCDGYGHRSRTTQQPVTPDTVFSIASLTKAFTVTALQMSAESGDIDLVGPLNARKNILSLSDDDITRRVSLIDILCHRTGLPAYDLLWYFNGITPEEMLAGIAALPIRKENFQKSFRYNNLLYGALGHRFAELTGTDWLSFIKQRIAAPLQLSLCKPAHSDTALPLIGEANVPEVDTALIAAAGGLRLNIKDMAVWITFLLGEGVAQNGSRLLSRESAGLTGQNFIDAGNANPLYFQGLDWLCQNGVGYGLGWFLGDRTGQKALFHPGLIDGLSHCIVLIPEEKTGVVVLTAANLSAAPGQLARFILNEILGEPSERATRQANPSGFYANPAFGTATIEAADEGFTLTYRNHRWRLTLAEDGSASFVIDAFGLQIPVSVHLACEGTDVTGISFALSLDPSDPPQLFRKQNQPLA